jgi:hypothetical protein
MLEKRAQIGFIINVYFEAGVSPDDYTRAGGFSFREMLRKTSFAEMGREKCGRRSKNRVGSRAVAGRHHHYRGRGAFHGK